MPRNPHVQRLGECGNQRQAELLAAQLTKGDDPFRDADSLEMFGEERHVLRVMPVGGQWYVNNYPVSALMWEAEDEADVPF